MKLLSTLLLSLLLLATPAAAQPNRSDVVKGVDAAYPHLLQTNTHEANAEFLCRVVAAMPEEWGFISKSAGENGVEIGGVRVSHDVIRHAASGRQVDIISGAGNHPSPGGPSWGPIDPAHYRPSNVPVGASICGGGIPTPPPTPTPTPTPPPPASVDLTPVLQALTALRAQLDALTAKVDAIAGVSVEARDAAFAAKAQAEHLGARLEAAHASILIAINLGEQQLATPYVGRVLGFPVVLRPVQP